MNLFQDGIFWTEWFMLSAVMGIGIWVSLVDFSTRKVPNKWTYGLLGLGLLGQGFMLAYDITSYSQIAHVFICGLIIAIGLMSCRFWGAGDGKFFWGIAIALPPTLCPSFDLISLDFAGLALLTNTLVVYLLFCLSAAFLTQTDGETSRKNQDEIREKSLNIAIRLAGLLGLTLGIGILILKRPLSYLEGLAALVIGYHLLRIFLRPHHWPVLIWPGIGLLLYTMLRTEGTGTTIYMIIWLNVWLLELAYRHIRYAYSRRFIQSIPISSIQLGNLLNQTLYKKKDGEQVIFSERSDNAEVLIKRGQPLKMNDLRILRQLVHKNKLPSDDRIEIEHTLPFVPFITAGALLTVLFAGNIATPLSRFLMRILSSGVTQL